MSAVEMVQGWAAKDWLGPGDASDLLAGLDGGRLALPAYAIEGEAFEVAISWLIDEEERRPDVDAMCDAALRAADDAGREATPLREVEAAVCAWYAMAPVRETADPARRADAEAAQAALARSLLPVAWAGSMQAYVRRGAGGTWDLGTPLTREGAEYELMRHGLSQRDAKARLGAKDVLNVFGFDCRPGDGDLALDASDRPVINTWAPPAVTPRPAPFPVIDEVLDFLTADDVDGKRWLVNWLAFAVQNPARPMRTAPIVYGAQRTGKSLLARVMRELLGEGNCAAVRNEDIRGRFTSHFVTKLFVTVGEIEAAEIPHASSTLKTWTGEPRLIFEAKGSAAFEVPNRMKVLCTSNQTLPVTVERGDTRWAMFYQPAEPDAEYGRRMRSLFETSTNGWSEKGEAELAGFAHHLATYSVDPELAATPPSSATRAEAIDASRSSVELFADAIDEVGSVDALWAQVVPDYRRTEPIWHGLDVNPRGHGQEGLVEGQALHALYVAHAKSIGHQRTTGAGRFAEELKRARPRRWTYLTDGRRPNVLRDDGQRLRVRAWAGLPRDLAARPSPFNCPFYRAVIEERA